MKIDEEMTDSFHPHVFDPELEQLLKRTFAMEGLTSQQISYMRTRLFQIGCLTLNDLNLLSDDTFHDIFAPILSLAQKYVLEEKARQDRLEQLRLEQEEQERAELEDKAKREKEELERLEQKLRLEKVK